MRTHVFYINVYSYIMIIASYIYTRFCVYNTCMHVYMQQVEQVRQSYEAVCGDIPDPTSRPSDGGAGVLKGLGIYSLLLVSLAAAVIF